MLQVLHRRQHMHGLSNSAQWSDSLQLVAVHGLQTWNPSFDVTPAHLIAGIITEHGLVPKAGQTFSFTAFAHSRVSSRLVSSRLASTKLSVHSLQTDT
jgi:Initiation factor 2 subunit family